MYNVYHIIIPLVGWWTIRYQRQLSDKGASCHSSLFGVVA